MVLRSINLVADGKYYSVSSKKPDHPTLDWLILMRNPQIELCLHEEF